MAGGRRQQGAASLGLFTAPVRAPASVSGDPVQDELAAWVRDRRRTDMVRQMETGATPAPVAATQPAAQVPQPVSLTEAVGAATAIAGLYKGTAEVEHDRRVEAEEDAAGSYQAGEQKTLQMIDMFNRTVEPLRQELTSLREEKHKAEVEAKEAGFKAELASLNAKLDAALGAKDREIAQQQTRADTLQKQVDALSQRETFEQVIGKAVAGGEIAPERVEMIRRVFGINGGADDPLAEANRLFIIGQAHAKLAKMQRDGLHEDGMQQEVRKLLGGLNQIVEGLKGSAPDLLRLITPPRAAGSSVPEDGWEEPGAGVPAQ